MSASFPATARAVREPSRVEATTTRTTNILQNLNREFRRRTNAQASFGTEDAALSLLYGLVAFGQIQLRKIDDHTYLPSSGPGAARYRRQSICAETTEETEETNQTRSNAGTEKREQRQI